jgi:L-lactate dehydrogenase complex protein LldE
MVRVHAPELFAGEPEWKERAEDLASRVFELTEFLHLEGFEPDSPFSGKVTYHASCHLLRELRLASEPRELLAKVPEIEVVEMPKAEDCCGFGGVFSVKMPDLSVSMMNAKLEAAESTGADVLTATDCGCLMHLGGALARRGRRLRTLHIAEILAGEAPPVP